MTNDAAPQLEYEGCRLTYRVRGSGPPVVFIQGVGLHGDGWRPQTEALAERFACLTFDNRGIAGSQPAPKVLTVEQMARDALALMTHQGWERAHLVGHSLGALVALETARLAPHRARSLALLCVGARGRDATRISWPILRLGVAAKLGSKRQARDAFLGLILPRAPRTAADRAGLAAEFLPLFGHDLAEQPPVVAQQLRALRAYDATPHLRGLPDVPVLVVAASADPVAPPRYGKALAEGVPGATYAEIPGAAHGVTLTHAEQVNTLLHRHLLAAERSSAA